MQPLLASAEALAAGPDGSEHAGRFWVGCDWGVL